MKSKYIVTILFLIASFLTLVTAVHADGECSTSYGGTTTCEPKDLTINKMVQDPITGAFVENITTSKFSQGDKVVFKLEVKNTSGQTFKNVHVKDNVPDNFVIDDADVNRVNSDGKKDISISSDKKWVDIRLDQFTAGSTAEFFVWTHLVGPYASEDSFCRDNWAFVTSDERPNGDRNFARVCVQNKVLGTTTLPAAGAEDLLIMLPFALTGLTGLTLLKKKSK